MVDVSFNESGELIRDFVYGSLGITGTVRSLALLMGVLLISTFLSIFYEVTGIVGGTIWLATGVAGAIMLGVVAVRLSPPVGLAITAILFGFGLGGYLRAVPNLNEALRSLALIWDFLDLLLGSMSVMQIYRADLWAVLIAPAPVYGTWYLLLRRRYNLAIWIGGAMLMFFVLTGDASESVSLVGAVSLLGVLGFGTLDHSDATWSQIREVGLLLAAVLIFTRLSRALMTQVTSSTKYPIDEKTMEGTSSPTVESTLNEASGEITILGSISLSPELRFTVAAEEPSYWFTGAYDRYTGDGWVRSGMVEEYTEPVNAPSWETQTFEQRFQAETKVATMPVAWKPVRVGDGAASSTKVTDLGGFQPTDAFRAGETYSVTSQRPVWTAEALRAVDDELPESIRRRYLQLPKKTPGRVHRFAADVTGDAESRYDSIIKVMDWLEAEKAYSLDVSRPESEVADSFIFNMKRGYCVYFATAMVVLLRSLEIPARFVAGYTSGQSISDAQWEIRGLNSHAWVQVYFPNHGWVRFDPTPSGPRELARARRLQEEGHIPDQNLDAFATMEANADLDSAGETPETQRASHPNSTPTDVALSRPAERGEANQNYGGSKDLTRRALFTNLSGSDKLAILGGLAGIALGISTLELPARAYRFASVQWQAPSNSPKLDMERAMTRLEWVLGQEYRERHPGETKRSYFESLDALEEPDQRLRQILRCYELAKYNNQISRESADYLMAKVDDYVHDYSLIELIFE